MERVSPLNQAIRDAIADRMRYRKFPKFSRLFDVGDHNHTCYFIEQGVVRIFYYKNGREVTGNFMREGQLIALTQSFYDGIPSRHGAEALEDTQTVELRYDELEDLYWQHPLLMNNSRFTSMRYNFYWRDRYELTTNQPVEKRYEELLLTAPDLIRRAPLNTLASYLGTTISHLSRIRSSMSG